MVVPRDAGLGRQRILHQDPRRPLPAGAGHPEDGHLPLSQPHRGCLSHRLRPDPLPQRDDVLLARDGRAGGGETKALAPGRRVSAGDRQRDLQGDPGPSHLAQPGRGDLLQEDAASGRSAGVRFAQGADAQGQRKQSAPSVPRSRAQERRPAPAAETAAWSAGPMPGATGRRSLSRPRRWTPARRPRRRVSSPTEAI